jgi:hypothetical protein
MFTILLPLNDEARVALANEVVANGVTSIRAHHDPAQGEQPTSAALTAATAECMARVHTSLVSIRPSRHTATTYKTLGVHTDRLAI